MQASSYTNEQMSQMEGKLAYHHKILELGKKDAVERNKEDLTGGGDELNWDDLVVDENQQPSVELEQSANAGLELRWHGYFKVSTDMKRQRIHAHVLVGDEQLRELVGEEFFVFEDQDAEPEDQYSEE